MPDRPVLPAARASAESRSTNSWSSLCTATGRPVSAISAKASTIVGWSIRGKRTASYSYVLSLNAVTPPAARSGIASSPPCFLIVPYSPMSTCAVRFTHPIFSSSKAALWMLCGTSYGMSMQVVMPPAAALRVAPAMPEKPMLLPVCMCPSTRPGKISRSAWSTMSAAGGGAPCPMAAMISPRIAT